MGQPGNCAKSARRSLHGFAAICLAAVILAPAPAGALRGDLCFPLEGWGLVSRWHLAAGARSAREGWMMRTVNEQSWLKRSAGTFLPASPHGSWLRNAFKFSPSQWQDALLEAADLPRTARPLRIFVNGRLIPPLTGEETVSLAPYLRSGVNSIALAVPAHGAREIKVPGLRVRRVGKSGKTGSAPVILRSWRVRAEEVQRYIPQSWLTGGDTAGWRMLFPFPPTEAELWLTPSPVCLKAVLDFPHYWPRGALSLFLHEMPGDPDVFINGRKVADRLHGPVRIDLAGLLDMDGRDTLCLVYPGLPRPVQPGDGNWGIAAIHWASGVSLPPFPSGTTLFFEQIGGEDEPGVGQALGYARQLLALSATPFALQWERREADGEVPRNPPAGILAVWPAPPFSLSGFDPLEEKAAARCARLNAVAAGPLWIMSPPAVGSKLEAPANSRLMIFRNRINKIAPANGASPLRVFDVFRSALRCQRRWPARPLFAETDGRLTGHGSFLMSLAVLDAFSLL